jgi:hypothetical protein
VLPFVLLFFMVLIEASLWFLARDAALAAARQGADAARVLDASRAAGPVAALGFARKSGAGYLLDPTASLSDSSAGTVSVTVTGHAPSFVPWLVVRVSETVQVPAEEFQS